MKSRRDYFMWPLALLAPLMIMAPAATRGDELACSHQEDIALRAQVRHRGGHGHLQAGERGQRGGDRPGRQRRLFRRTRRSTRPWSCRWSTGVTTVFTVVHGSQPRYTVPEIVDGHEPGRPGSSAIMRPTTAIDAQPDRR